MDNQTDTQKLKILFLASDPSNESRLHLGKELQSIRNKLKDNRHFEMKDHLATKHTDIMNEIMNYKPQIVHFSGHGTEEGELMFEDEIGNSKSVPPDALATLFSLTKDFVKCVIVNTCFSEKQAKSISQFTPVVIGTKSEISDEAAISFSTGFYTALNPDLSIESLDKAFNLGKIAIQFSGNIGEELKPIILYGTDEVRFASEVDSAFTFIKNPKGKAVEVLIKGLSLSGEKMGLSPNIVDLIIRDKITKLNIHNDNLKQYETSLRAIYRDEYPLSESSKAALNYLQSGLNLSNEDVKQIQKKVLDDPKIEDAFSWYNRGFAQQDIDNYDSSIEYFTKAIQKNKEYSAAYSERGNCYSKSSNHNEAIKDFTKAIEINKNWEISSNLSLTYFNRGYSYLELSAIGEDIEGNFEKGIDDFQKVIELNPKESAAYYNIAFAYEKLEKFKEALKWYEEALDAGYDSTKCYSGIVKCCSEIGDTKKYNEWLKRYGEYNSNILNPDKGN